MPRNPCDSCIAKPGLHAMEVARRKIPGRGSYEESSRYCIKAHHHELKSTMNEVKNAVKKIWPSHLKEMKQRGEKIAMLTAYDALMARLLEQAGIDVLLVGDSLGMVLLGYSTTLPGDSGRNGSSHQGRQPGSAPRAHRRRHAVPDLSDLVPETIRNAGRLIQEGGANAVKIEGGQRCRRNRRAAGRNRHPGDGPPGTESAIGESGRAASASRLSRRRTRGVSSKTPRRWSRPASFAIVLESIPEELARDRHRRACAFLRSASAPARIATARCWSATTLLG